MAKRQSVGKLAAKQAIRTTGNRLITDSIGNGILGAIAKTLLSQAVKATDKYELNHDSDFGITSIERR